ncbi:MAG TPA: YfhO family protein [Pyrinomonadaceae bacterium]|nr:YfhO family protein [Pyrinomonadaceae bacterium]
MASNQLPFRSSLSHPLFVVFLICLLFTIFFSPVLFYDHLLAPSGGRLGDGIVYHLTFFKSSKVLWDNLLASGFPMIADPQVMAWYPPAFLLSLIPGSWNAFVLAAYVMASCFTYGYVYTITGSKLAAAVSGVTYGLCGFLVAHMGHTSMIHSAVWLPLIVWSLEKLRREFRRPWLALACAAVACCVLAGHIQIVVYSLAVSAAYAFLLGWVAPIGRKRFYFLTAAVFVIGLGLSALQLLPAKELAGQSLRTGFSFQDFVSYSFPFKHIPSLVFPAVFGGLPTYGKTPYFGEWNFIEMCGYAGLLPLILATIGLIAHRRNGIALFWLSVAIFAFLLALGERTPLASLVYQLPVVSQFRAPARYVFLVGFAVSVLSGFGVWAIQTRKVSRRLLLSASAVLGLVMVASFALLWSDKVQVLAIERGASHFTLRPWVNPAIGIPLLVFAAAVIALVFWHQRPASILRQCLVIAVLLLDLGSFGWFMSWRFDATNKNVLNEPPTAAKTRDLLADSHQRMLSIRGNLGQTDELIPNLSRLWNVPNATGYGPLLPSRIMYLLSMLPDGSVAPTWKNAEDQSLSLTSVRYVLLPKTTTAEARQGVSWPVENMDIWLGQGCNHPPRTTVEFNLPVSFKSDSVGIVSRLGCAVPIKDSQEVARLFVTDVDGRVEEHPILAGRDSSEWSYDCPTIKPNMAHRRAEVFSSFPAEMNDQPCQGHYYVTRLKLKNAAQINRVEIRSTSNEGAFVVDKVSLIDELTQTSEPVSTASTLAGPWRFVETLGAAHIYENTRAMPRAWLVNELINLSPEAALVAIKTSRLPDGREFNPSQMALVENALQSNTADSGASAKVMHLSDTVMEVQTSSANPTFLVTSDVYYPGWQASVDGKMTEIHRTNYALRGVEVPAGVHTVRFEFRPKSFYYGLGVSMLSILVLAAALYKSPGKKFM